MFVRQVVRWIAVVALCGWFAVGVAFAEGDDSGGGGLSDGEVAGFGCLAAGGGMFASGYALGPSEAIMLWGGGLLVPSGSAVLAISLLGALGAAGCSLGATLAPTFLWVSDQASRLLSHH